MCTITANIKIVSSEDCLYVGLLFSFRFSALCGLGSQEVTSACWIKLAIIKLLVCHHHSLRVYSDTAIMGVASPQVSMIL